MVLCFILLTGESTRIQNKENIEVTIYKMVANLYSVSVKSEGIHVILLQMYTV